MVATAETPIRPAKVRPDARAGPVPSVPSIPDDSSLDRSIQEDVLADEANPDEIRR